MDDELIQRAQAGDTEAFRALVLRYSDIAWRTARVLLGARGPAEDAVQEAWLDAWRGLAGFQRDRPFRPWLLTLVANRCRMALRRRTTTTTRLTEQIAEALHTSEDIASDAAKRETDAELRKAIARLPADHARVLELRFYADLDLAEIAEATGAPLGTVKSRLHRALVALRTHLPQSAVPLTNGDSK